MTAVQIRGTRYPLVLPTVRDPRLHLLAVILSLQALGQVAFGFRVSIAQILISLGTCALLEAAIVFRRQRVLMWPASALLTANGVAFVLRVPGTQHGQWWSLHGWWIFAATAAGSLLSKHLVRLHGAHVFNPSNVGLVVCFLSLGPRRADPLDFWWGPMSAWMALALAIIVVGGLAILSRLGLLAIAVSFWIAFVAAIAVVAATGHAMTARWHLGPIEGPYFWKVLATSPEILVFCFFMITDPKTIPARPRARIAYAVSIGLLAALLIAPTRTEFWAKVALLGSLAIVCLARPLAALLPSLRLSLDPPICAGGAPVWTRRAAFRPGGPAERPAITHPGGSRLSPRRVAVALSAGVLAYAGGLVAAGLQARAAPAATVPAVEPAVRLPQVLVAPSRGVDGSLDRPTALRIARYLALEARRGRLPLSRLRRITLWIEAGSGQVTLLVARLEGMRRDTADRPRPVAETVEIGQTRQGYRITRVRS